MSMLKVPESLRTALKAWWARHADVSEDTRLLELNEVVFSGVAIARMPCGPVVTFSDRTGQPGRPDAGGIVFSSEQRALIAACGLKPENVAPHIAAMRAEAATKKAVSLRDDTVDAVPLTTDEQGELRRMKDKAIAGTLPPTDQDRLLSLMNRSLASRGGAR